MAKQGNKKKTSAGAPKKKTQNKAKRAPMSKRTKITILCVVLAVLLVAGAVLGTVLYLNNRPFNYYKEDISKYIGLDTEAYKDYTIEMKLDAITELSVDERINQLLNANKSNTAQNGGLSDRNVAIRVGDVATIFYRGYYFNDKNERVEFNGGSNIQYQNGKVTADALTIGSGMFFSGFENDLIGKVPEEYTKLEVVTDGVISEGDIVYVSMSAVLPGNKSFQNKTVRIDLSAPDVEKEWGVGIKEFFIGKELRQVTKELELELPETVEGQSKVHYSSIKPMFLTKDESNPIVVEAYCSISHTDPTLAGKTLYFDVFVQEVVHYDTPTLTESFIRDTLKLTDEDLNKYEGADIFERFRGYVREELMSGYQTSGQQVAGYRDTYDSLLDEKIWEKLDELTKIIKIPKRAIQPVYEDYLDTLVADYEYYKDTYGYSSVEQYICDAMGEETLEAADETIWYLSANAVKEKMVIFLIAKAEGLLDDEDAIKKQAQEMFDEVMVYYVESVYAEQFKKYDTQEKYDAAYAELEASLREQYTEDYLAESAIYEMVFEKLREYPTVTLVGRGQ